MRATILLLLAFTLSGINAFGQKTKVKNKDIYPNKYTLEKAMEFEKKGEYEIAIWFYINIFPENKTNVIESVKNLAAKLDSVDMNMLIKKSFSIYSTFDPTITTFKNGMPNIDTIKLKIKGAWGDELSMKITEEGQPLSSASEYSIRSIERYKAKDYIGAIEDLDKAIEMKPSGEYYYNRAFTKSMINEYESAIKDFDKAIELKYKLAQAYFERGFCKDMTDNLKGAIADYTQAIDLNKDFSDAYNNRGFVYYKQKDFKNALNDFDEAIKLKSNYAIAYLNRGHTKIELKDIEGACTDLQKALDLGNKEAQIYISKYCK